MSRDELTGVYGISLWRPSTVSASNYIPNDLPIISIRILLYPTRQTNKIDPQQRT